MFFIHYRHIPRHSDATIDPRVLNSSEHESEACRLVPLRLLADTISCLDKLPNHIAEALMGYSKES